jgi:hypothetical protein
MGWTPKSNTMLKYQHYFNDDAMDAMLEADGLPIAASANGNNNKSSSKGLLKPKLCPNCDESNKSDSKFCVNCKFVLSCDTFYEAVEEKEKAAREAERAKKALEELESRQKQIEERMAANYNRLQHEVMRLSRNRLDSIKDERKRQEEEIMLEVVGVEALEEMEREEAEREEAAKKRAAAAEPTELIEDDNNNNDPNYATELEIEAYKKQ